MPDSFPCSPCLVSHASSFPLAQTFPVLLSAIASCLPCMPVMQGCYARGCVDSCSVQDGGVACLVHLEEAELGFIQDLIGRGI